MTAFTRLHTLTVANTQEFYMVGREGLLITWTHLSSTPRPENFTVAWYSAPTSRRMCTLRIRTFQKKKSAQTSPKGHLTKIRLVYRKWNQQQKV